MNSLVPLQQNVANQFTFANAAKGFELSGGHSYGGYHYSVAIFDQNTSGVSQSSNSNPYVPSATAALTEASASRPTPVSRTFTHDSPIALTWSGTP